MLVLAEIVESNNSRIEACWIVLLIDWLKDKRPCRAKLESLLDLWRSDNLRTPLKGDVVKSGGVYEGVPHIEPVNRPVTRGGDAEDVTDRCWFNNRAKGLVRFCARLLREAMYDPDCLVLG